MSLYLEEQEQVPDYNESWEYEDYVESLSIQPPLDP